MNYSDPTGDSPAEDRRIGPGWDRGQALTIHLDGRPLRAYEGETVAAALFAAGVTAFRTTERLAELRGPYCNMGVCFDCVAEIDGRPNVRTCRTLVAEGMQVRTQVGVGQWDMAPLPAPGGRGR